MRETKMKKVLALVLAFAMVMAMGVMTFAEPQTTATPSIDVVDNGDGTATLTLSAKGNLAKWDFGVTYENATFVSRKWDNDFRDAYDGVKGIMSDNDQKDYSYVVLGGTAQDLDWDGAVATITFNIQDGAKFGVVTDSAAIKEAIDAEGDPKPLATKTGGNTVAPKPAGGQPTQVPTQAPTQAPSQAPSQAPTQAPSQAPTQAPSQAPSKAPATPAPKGNSPKTADTATVVIPMVAIVAAAAAVVVASKKKVED